MSLGRAWKIKLGMEAGKGDAEAIWSIARGGSPKQPSLNSAKGVWGLIDRSCGGVRMPMRWDKIKAERLFATHKISVLPPGNVYWEKDKKAQKHRYKNKMKPIAKKNHNTDTAKEYQKQQKILKLKLFNR